MATPSPSPIPGVRDSLVQACVAMSKYALASGLRLPSATAALVEQARSAPPADGASDVAGLSRVHDQLCQLVAPATPRCLLAMGDESGGSRSLAMLGPVGLVRRMMVAALLSMIVFIGTSLTTYVDNSATSLQNSSGLPLLVVELFWLSAAAIGASFAMLMKVSSYVVRRCYDPKYESSYWIQFFLGVMSGFILVALLPTEHALGTTVPASGGATVGFMKPALALLGGCSASAVYRIIARMVDTVESVFRGDTKDELARSVGEARSRATEATAQARVGLAAQIVRMQQEVNTGADSARLSARLHEILGGLIPDTVPDAPRSAVALAPEPRMAALPYGLMITEAEVATAPENRADLTKSTKARKARKAMKAS